jgi:CBS-domain-containing membrane protein
MSGPATRNELIAMLGPVDDLVIAEIIGHCFQDAELDEVAGNMADIKVRRLPVLDQGKRLVGIPSLGDIALTEGASTAAGALSGISEPGGEHSQSARA